MIVYGGGIFAKEMTIKGSVVHENVAFINSNLSGALGGGGFFEKSIISESSFSNNLASSININTSASNTSAGAYGGGAYAKDFTTIINSSFINNLSSAYIDANTTFGSSTAGGGGVRLYNSSIISSLSANNSVMSTGKALTAANPESYGAGVYASDSSYVSNTTVVNNNSMYSLLSAGEDYSYGGGCYVDNSIATNSVFINNRINGGTAPGRSDGGVQISSRSSDVQSSAIMLADNGVSGSKFIDYETDNNFAVNANQVLEKNFISPNVLLGYQDNEINADVVMKSNWGLINSSELINKGGNSLIAYIDSNNNSFDSEGVLYSDSSLGADMIKFDFNNNTRIFQDTVDVGFIELQENRITLSSSSSYESSSSDESTVGTENYNYNLLNSKVAMRIYSVTGSLLWNGKITPEDLKDIVYNLPKGVYIVNSKDLSVKVYSK